MKSNLNTVRQIALSFPGVVESTSYGTPAFKLKDKLLIRMHQDGTSLVLKMDFENRDFMMQFNPEVYYITDHYRKYPYVLVRLDLVDHEELKNHFERLWRMNATKKMLEEFSKKKNNGNN
jgi:hypothetical protein